MNKALVIAPYNYLPSFSGGQKFIARFLEHLARHVDLTVLSVKNNNYSLASGYRTIPILNDSFFRYMDPSLVGSITNLIRKEKFDTVIWEHPYYAWLAGIVKRRTGIKTIIHTHNIEHQRFRSTGRWWWPVLKRYEKAAFQLADKIFFITPEDREFAIDQWNIAPTKCFDLPYGVDVANYPSDRIQSRELIEKRFAIGQEEKILFFNGLLDYKPNLDALKVILEEINPFLLSDPSFKYRVIISGKRLPASLNGLKDHKNIIYAGFVDDIGIYYKASAIFLNPVLSGGGIKTKMVEAIAYGTTVISTMSGAAGMNREICGNKLVVVKDGNWNKFSEEILVNSSQQYVTPPSYYDYYNWEKIISRIKDI
jgi:polysaccharide biosynthesis protein PslH